MFFYPQAPRIFYLIVTTNTRANNHNAGLEVGGGAHPELGGGAGIELGGNVDLGISGNLDDNLNPVVEVEIDTPKVDIDAPKFEVEVEIVEPIVEVQVETIEAPEVEFEGNLEADCDIEVKSNVRVDIDAGLGGDQDLDDGIEIDVIAPTDIVEY